jgi:SAM-dependent methyltransferase
LFHSARRVLNAGRAGVAAVPHADITRCSAPKRNWEYVSGMDDTAISTLQFGAYQTHRDTQVVSTDPLEIVTPAPQWSYTVWRPFAEAEKYVKDEGRHVITLRKRVLDVGCGVGHHSAFCTEAGAEVVGVDGRPENIAAMATLYPKVTGVVGDPQKTDLTPLGSFDIVHCFGLLYHVESPVAALRRLAAVCREQLMWRWRWIGFAHVYGTTAPPDHPDFLFEWRNSLDTARDGHNLRCILVASRSALACPHLVPLISLE